MRIRDGLTIAILMLLTACAAPHSDLTSPCVGIEGSPCEHHPVNDWWLKQREDS